MALYLVLLLHVCWERFLVFLEGVFFYFIKADILLFCFCLNLSAVSFVSQVWSFHCNRACPYLSVVAPSQENYPIVLCFLKLIRRLAFLFFFWTETIPRRRVLGWSVCMFVRVWLTTWECLALSLQPCPLSCGFVWVAQTNAFLQLVQMFTFFHRRCTHVIF